jgi:hypothetical protein
MQRAMAAEEARQRFQVEAGSNADDNRLAELVDERCDGFLHLLRLDGEDQQIADGRQQFGRCVAVDRVSRAQLFTGFAARIDDIDVGCDKPLFQHAAD